MERVVNIIGLGSTASTLPDTGENWGINVAYVHGKMDKLFFFDDWEIIDSDSSTFATMYGITMEQYLTAHPETELISRNQMGIRGQEGQLLAEVKQFPLMDAIRLSPMAYFNSTIAYVIAYAILQKVDRIRLYGFELWASSNANEYMYQRPCVEYWLAFALGRGIKVDIPYQTMLTNNQDITYGYKLKEI